MTYTRRDIGKAAVAAAFTGFGASAAFAARDATPVGIEAVDPELAPFLLTRRNSDLGPATLSAWRNAPTDPFFAQRPSPAPQLRRRAILGPNGAPPVGVFVVDPMPGKTGRPAVLYVHGGGYVMFAADRAPAILQDLAVSLGCVVVAVDYRLAPETPFPGPSEDIYAALVWLDAEADSLGIDRSRIAIFGESAGGGHAANLAITARDRQGPRIAAQVLIYPMLDDRTGSSRRAPRHVGRFVWTEGSNRYAWSAYLGRAAGGNRVPAGAVPARVSSVAGLPPTYIGVGALDLFAPECLTYAERLVGAGVPTEVHVVPGAVHGFDLIAPKAKISRRFTMGWQAAIARGIGVPVPS
jgi:acetyl esterase/lipase